MSWKNKYPLNTFTGETKKELIRLITEIRKKEKEEFNMSNRSLKEKIEELSCKYANDNGQFHVENTVSLKTEIIERELKKFFSDLRKRDEEELIKLICDREVFEDKLNKKTIKDYYKE